MSANPMKQHPIVILGVIIFFAVTALIVFRLSSGAKTDTRKNRILTVGTMSADETRPRRSTYLYRRSHPQPTGQHLLPGRRLHRQDLCG